MLRLDSRTWTFKAELLKFVVQQTVLAKFIDLFICARSMLLGDPAPLKSSFKLSYYTLLNLLRRVEGTEQSMDDVIKKSFQQFQHERMVPKVEFLLDESVFIVEWFR